MEGSFRQLRADRGIVKVYVTKRCNLGCVMCDNWRHRPQPGEELSTAEWSDVLRAAHAIGFRKVVFFGGEPTLRSDLVDLVACARQVGYRAIRVYTHAFNLNEQRIDALLAAGANRFSFSMDSPDFEVNDRIRGMAGVGRKTAEAVRIVADRKRVHPALRSEVNATVQRDTFRDLPALFDRVHELGGDTATITPLIAKGEESMLRTIHDLSLDPRERREFTERIAPALWERALAYGYDLRREDVFVFTDGGDSPIAEYQRRYPCFVPWTRLIVREDGAVVGCNKVAPHLRPLGSVRQASLEAIWSSPDAVAFRGACASMGTYPKMPGCESCCFGQAAENRDLARALGMDTLVE